MLYGGHATEGRLGATVGVQVLTVGTAEIIASDREFEAESSVDPPSCGDGICAGFETCIACHSGPASIAEIRSSHPERGNCRQCHMPRLTQEVFDRNVRP